MATAPQMPQPLIPPIPAELDAMSRHWDAMADAVFDFTTDRFERAKAQFYAARAEGRAF